MAISCIHFFGSCRKEESARRVLVSALGLGLGLFHLTNNLSHGSLYSIIPRGATFRQVSAGLM